MLWRMLPLFNNCVATFSFDAGTSMTIRPERRDPTDHGVGSIPAAEGAALEELAVAGFANILAVFDHYSAA